ncbi:MAG: hypothetical protein Q9181_002632 [Wetmoreana brouardii]
MTSEDPYSSITAGPASPTPELPYKLGAPVSPITTPSSLEILTSTSRSQVSTSIPASTTLPGPTPPASLYDPTSQVHSHSKLAAGLGGTAAIAVGIVLFFLSRRKQREVEKVKQEPHQMPTVDKTPQLNSTLFPAALNHEDSKVSMSPVELESKVTDIPSGPDELQGEERDQTKTPPPPPKSSKRLNSRVAETTAGPYELYGEEGFSAYKPSLPPRSSRRPSPFIHPAIPGHGDLLDSRPVSSLTATGAIPRRPSAGDRPDSMGSTSGPWHDSY